MKVEKILALARLGALDLWKVAEEMHKRENTEESHKEVDKAWQTVEEIEEASRLIKEATK